MHLGHAVCGPVWLGVPLGGVGFVQRVRWAGGWEEWDAWEEWGCAMNTLQYYVCGFLFSDDQNYVALIMKNHPGWQRQRYNGIGGHVNESEGLEAAMEREFYEEAGVAIDSWRRFCTLLGEGFEVVFFVAYGDVTKVRSETDERVVIFNVHNLPPNCLPNVPWLIAMALSFSRGEHADYLMVREKVGGQ
jgi:8-oxo-dGTP pyrophosphatase MutT (NUDIX family)